MLLAMRSIYVGQYSGTLHSFISFCLCPPFSQEVPHKEIHSELQDYRMANKQANMQS